MKLTSLFRRKEPEPASKTKIQVITDERMFDLYNFRGRLYAHGIEEADISVAFIGHGNYVSVGIPQDPGSVSEREAFVQEEIGADRAYYIGSSNTIDMQLNEGVDPARVFSIEDDRDVYLLSELGGRWQTLGQSLAGRYVTTTRLKGHWADDIDRFIGSDEPAGRVRLRLARYEE